MDPLPQKPSRPHLSGAFSLVELLVVIAIIAVLAVLVMPAMGAIKGAGNTTKAAYDITGVLDNARAYAMANKTYVWVGFYEESSDAGSPTSAQPPYPGKGRVLLAAVASKDGSRVLDSSAADATNRITQITKVMKISGIHMVDIGAPASPSTSDSLDGRPGGAAADLSSESSAKTQYPFSAQGYSFYKTICFSPRGESLINGTNAFQRLAEIGLRPTHGGSVDSKTAVAIQLTGIGGTSKIYRK